jgi:hypothetical protein
MVCKKSFSTATLDPYYGQRKRHMNLLVLKELVSCVSQRRCAKILKLNKNTVEAKFIFLGRFARDHLQAFNLKFPKATQIQFDDLETFEHTKMKTLSVTLAVEFKTRRFLGYSVSQMPSKGRLAARSRKKYGKRKDERSLGRRELFTSLKDLIHPRAEIQSDQNPHYPDDVKKFFPNAQHITMKGSRGSTTGQGELKKVVYDPLFSLNHTCAKLRADVNRLVRKTWCTTKKKERLEYHIGLFALYHNATLKSLKHSNFT